MLPERQQLLKIVKDNLTKSKNQVEGLKHDVYSCPKENEQELTEKLTALTNQITSCEVKYENRQHRLDKQTGKMIQEE